MSSPEKVGQRTPHGISYVEAGGNMPGMTMQVFDAGTTDLNALIMFVVDATFSVPTKFTASQPACPNGYSTLREICMDDKTGDIVLPADRRSQQASK